MNLSRLCAGTNEVPVIDSKHVTGPSDTDLANVFGVEEAEAPQPGLNVAKVADSLVPKVPKTPDALSDKIDKLNSRLFDSEKKINQYESILSQAKEAIIKADVLIKAQTLELDKLSDARSAYNLASGAVFDLEKSLAVLGKKLKQKDSEIQKLRDELAITKRVKSIADDNEVSNAVNEYFTKKFDIIKEKQENTGQAPNIIKFNGEELYLGPGNTIKLTPGDITSEALKKLVNGLFPNNTTKFDFDDIKPVPANVPRAGNIVVEGDLHIQVAEPPKEIEGELSALEGTSPAEPAVDEAPPVPDEGTGEISEETADLFGEELEPGESSIGGEEEIAAAEGEEETEEIGSGLGDSRKIKDEEVEVIETETNSAEDERAATITEWVARLSSFLMGYSKFEDFKAFSDTHDLPEPIPTLVNAAVDGFIAPALFNKFYVPLKNLFKQYGLDFDILNLWVSDSKVSSTKDLRKRIGDSLYDAFRREVVGTPTEFWVLKKKVNIPDKQVMKLGSDYIVY